MRLFLAVTLFLPLASIFAIQTIDDVARELSDWLRKRLSDWFDGPANRFFGHWLVETDLIP